MWSATLRRYCASVLLLVVLLAGAGTAVQAAPDSVVEAVQRALVERNFDPGQIDGAMGPRTRGAISAFQRAFGLPDTGQADAATLEALGLALPGAEDARVEPRVPQVERTPPAGASGTGTGAGTGTGTGAGTGAGTDAEPEPSRESPSSETRGSGPTTERDIDVVESGSDPDAPAPVPEPADTGSDSAAPGTGTPRAEPASAVDGVVTDTDTSRAEPAAKATAAPEGRAATKSRLSYSVLGWRPPQTGGKALERLGALGVPRDFKRGTGSLFVPKSALVFVLRKGERIPGLDCDPGAGQLSIEFVFGPDGPAIFTPDPGGSYCQMGIGIALSVGRTLEMRRIEWGDARYRPGTVRLTNEGLEYVR